MTTKTYGKYKSLTIVNHAGYYTIAVTMNERFVDQIDACDDSLR